MKKIGDYPLFPRLDCVHADLDRRTWTKEQGKEYFDWLMNVKGDRVQILLEFFEESLDDDRQAFLLRIGEAFADEIKMEQYWLKGGQMDIKFKTGHTAVVDRGTILSADGCSIAADMGLLVADILLRDFAPAIKWKLLTRAKNHVNYNCPVLTGKPDCWNPIAVACVNAIAMIDGQETSDFWWRLYSDCKNKASEHAD